MMLIDLNNDDVGNLYMFSYKFGRRFDKPVKILRTYKQAKQEMSINSTKKIDYIGEWDTFDVSIDTIDSKQS